MSERDHDEIKRLRAEIDGYQAGLRNVEKENERLRDELRIAQFDAVVPVHELREYNDRLRFDLEQRDAELRRAWQSADQLATSVSEQHDEIERLLAENRKLWGRDHARGHRPTSDCPACSLAFRESQAGR